MLTRFTGLRALPRIVQLPRTFSSVSSATSSSPTGNDIEGRITSAIFTVPDKPGSLGHVLSLFEKHGVNLTSISSRPSKANPFHYDMHLDFEGRAGDSSVDTVMTELRDFCLGVREAPPAEVPWFPTRIKDIDHFSQKTLDAGAELDCDHPGFSDEEYRERRRMITDIALNYKVGEPIPRIEYTENEVATWGLVYNRLKAMTKQYGVREYNHILPALEANCGYSDTNIPQLEDISQFLQDCTGFRLKPVGGLLSARDFLNGLAFRIFFSTQYIRHHTKPLYTPEPDICHELIGHAPMFADPAFAQFSHEIGLASLGASDEDIKRLATCYWFSVEFGLSMEDGERKAYGAGLLSSFGELEYACSPSRPAGGETNFPEYRPWNPLEAATQEYPITTYQPVYFVAESLDDACDKMKAFCETVPRPFHVVYDPYTQRVNVDRAVNRGAYRVTLQT